MGLGVPEPANAFRLDKPILGLRGGAAADLTGLVLTERIAFHGAGGAAQTRGGAKVP
jgi:hypothetical protein